MKQLSISEAYHSMFNFYCIEKNGEITSHNCDILSFVKGFKENATLVICGVPFKYVFSENGSYLEDINHSTINLR